MVTRTRKFGVEVASVLDEGSTDNVRRIRDREGPYRARSSASFRSASDCLALSFDLSPCREFGSEVGASPGG